MFTTLIMIAVVAVALFLMSLLTSTATRRNKLTALCNIAEGTHEGSITKLTDAAISVRHLLYKQGTDAHHIAVNGAADMPWGVVKDEASAAEARVAVDLLGQKAGTMLMVASEAIDANEPVYTAAGGKVQDEPAVAGTYWLVGYAKTTVAADNAEIEVQHIVPIKVVVVAAFTSTNGVAAAASADLAALAAEAEKIGDDVRALGTALATPALVKVLAA